MVYFIWFQNPSWLGGMATGSNQQVWWQEAESSHLQMQDQSRESKLGAGEGCKICGLSPSDKLPSARLHLLNLSKGHHLLGTEYIKYLNPGSVFLIQTTTSIQTIIQ